MARVDNQLIESLPRADRHRLMAACDTLELQLSEVLHEAEHVSRYVYFPIEGFVSLLKPVPGYPGLEVGMIGSEGMVGAHVILGAPSSPLRAIVQGAGSARRIGVKEFRSELDRSPAMQHRMHLYIAVLMQQLASSAVCSRFHLIGPRLARWLLMSHDRARSDTFHVTHEFLAYMLGVRREGITGAASALQSSGLIEYRRGELTVRDRPGLELVACSCYRDDTEAYSDLMSSRTGRYRRPK